MLSNMLSVTTIILSTVMKAPQIIRIYNQKQTSGISLTSLLLDLIKVIKIIRSLQKCSKDWYVEVEETLLRAILRFCLFSSYDLKLKKKLRVGHCFGSLSTTTCYNYTNNYSLMSYLEYPIILFQQYILIGTVLFYNNRLNSMVLILSIFYIGLFSAFVGGILPSTILTFLVPFGTPISLSSKSLQLYTIMKFKNANSISLTTWSISAYTNGARIYTILMDSADKMLLTNFCLNTSLSTSILLASVYYKQTTTKHSSKNY